MWPHIYSGLESMVGRANSEYTSTGLLAGVFLLVTSAFTVIYITQPVLPVLQREFGVTASAASMSVSAVILGMALATLPFGMAADRYSIQRLVMLGGAIVIPASLICAWTDDFALLLGARLVQGIFVPTLTTCVAAYLSRTLDATRLNVMMGAYVSATVAGGLAGRLLGGWIHTPLHWRYAFVSSAALLLAAIVFVVPRLKQGAAAGTAGALVSGARQLFRWPLLRAYGAAFGSFAAFSAVFTYFPFYVAAPPWNLSTDAITSLYLVYVVALFVGTGAGRLSNRYGSARVLIAGTLLFGVSLFMTLVPLLPILILSLIGISCGFFAIHAAAVGNLNRNLSSDRGKGNALYTLFYYLGGATGISVLGQLYGTHGWVALAAFSAAFLVLPIVAGILELWFSETRAATL